MNNIVKKLFSLDEHSHPVDKLAKLNSIISGFALYPQLFKIIFGNPTVGLSYATFLMISVNSIIWVIYGYHRKTMPLLISSSLNFLSSTGIFLMIILK